MTGKHMMERKFGGLVGAYAALQALISWYFLNTFQCRYVSISSVLSLH